MPPAPRHNHRWQRALAWICLLLAAATAVPIGVSFVAGVEGPMGSYSANRYSKLLLTNGMLARVPVHLTEFYISISDSPAKPRAAIERCFGPLTLWSARWARVGLLGAFVFPVWWVPPILAVSGLLFTLRVGGLFAMRQRGARTVVVVSMLLAANAACSAANLPIDIRAGCTVPLLGTALEVHEGWLCAGGPARDPTFLDALLFFEGSRVRPGNLRGSRLGVMWEYRPGHPCCPWVGGIATWWLNIAFGTALLWIGVRAYRRGRDPGACSACGYSLAGLTTPTCPECGKAPA